MADILGRESTRLRALVEFTAAARYQWQYTRPLVARDHASIVAHALPLGGGDVQAAKQNDKEYSLAVPI